MSRLSGRRLRSRIGPMISLVIGVVFTFLAVLMMANAALGLGLGIFFFYFYSLYLVLFLVAGILGLIVAYRTWPR